MSDMDPYSERANEVYEAAKAKQARGEKLVWSDVIGILQPNPNLPDCQSWRDYDSDVKCDLPNHHDGPHRASLEW